ncbi:MAG: type IV pilus twitching motility protein PilT [Bdellovibrionales bacterium]
MGADAKKKKDEPKQPLVVIPAGVPSESVTNATTIKAQSQLDTMATLLTFLKENGGSDIHIAANNRVMIRIRGTMRPVNYFVSDEDVHNLIMPVIDSDQRQQLERDKSLDFSFHKLGIGVFRANVFYQRHGLAFVLRILPENPPTIDELDLPSIIKRTCYTDNGLILVTGPTGSGKSTTLAAMINEINMSQRGHIITIEDPVEFLHESKKCMVNQRSLQDHFIDFASALKSSLREDPDVILVGEMRDRETMQMAIRAAETGHLVLSTLHTNSAAKAIDRILNSFPADEQDEVRTVLSETLRLVVSQKLIPNRNGTKLKLFLDILVNNRGVANLIREGKTYLIENAMQTGADEGMMLMDRAIREAAEEGAIRMADAHEIANDKRIIEESAAFLRNEAGIVETVNRLAREEFGGPMDPKKIKENEKEGGEKPEVLIKDGIAIKGSGQLPKELIGIKDIVAELKPGFRKPGQQEPEKPGERKSPVNIKQVK